MDPKTELRVRLRDYFESRGISTRAALPGGTEPPAILERRVVSTNQVEGIAPQLAGVVSGELQELIAPRIAWAEQKLGVRLQRGEQPWHRWVEFVQTDASVLAAALSAFPLPQDEQLRMKMLMAGQEGVTDAPPFALQDHAGSPVALFYWGVAYRLVEAVFFAWPGELAWEDEAEWKLRVDAQLAANSPLRVAAEALSLLAPWVQRCSALARLQWECADIVGSRLGIDGVGLEWYPYASTYGAAAGQRLRQYTEAGGPHPAASWMREQVPATLALDILGRVTRHIFDGSALEVPPLHTVRITVGDRVVSTRVVINNGLVPASQVGTLARRERSSMNPGSKSLRPKDEEFLSAVAAAGGSLTKRLPRGFWYKFVAKWNEDHPAAPYSVNHARVRYHRLSKRLRAGHGSS